MNEARVDLARSTLGVLCIGGLLLTSIWVLRPFLGAFVWAAMIVIATWPLLRSLQALFGGRRGPATTVMALAVLLLFVVPFIVAIGVIVDHSDDVAALAGKLAGLRLPPPPAWLADMPLAGPRLADAWQKAVATGAPDLAQRLEPHLRDFTKWLVFQVGALGMLFLQGVLIAILAAVLYAQGEAWANWMAAFGRRLAGERGAEAVVLAGRAVRGVALGVVLTAIIQSLLGGLGLLMSGVPFPGALTAAMFVLCIAQLGPLLIMAAATAWLFANDATGWGSAMVVWTIVVAVLDNIMRPILIKRGADLPLLLIFAGVVGGLLSFGVIGLFIGPVVLAVTHTLVDAWVRFGPGYAPAVQPANEGH